MNMDRISEERLKDVHPVLAEKVRQMAEMLEQENIVIRVTQGLRSWTQQWALWMKGRDERGSVVDPKAVVTKAPPGYSWHSFGLACDVAPFDDGLPDWNTSHPAWKRIVEVGESLGLTAGAEWRTFPDWPHFQLTGRFPVTPDDYVRQTFRDGGMTSVWEEAKIT